jgi:hypothetical protein
VGAFGPVGHGGEYLDEITRVCGHGSDEDVAREVSVWMEHERHKDGGCGSVSARGTGLDILLVVYQLSRLMLERGFRLLSNLKSLCGSQVDKSTGQG